MLRSTRIVSLSFLGCAVLAGAGTGCGSEPSLLDTNADQRADGERLGTSADALTLKCGAPANGPIQGRDVSFYQGAFDWAGAKARDGVLFGYARVSDGNTYVDSTFPGNWASMKNAGVLRGAYQYFEPAEDEVAQANLMIQKVGGKLGDGDLPAVVDVETAGGQSPATIVAKLKRWLQIVEAGTGKRPWIYTGGYFWQDNVGDTSFGDYPLWIPAYGPVCPSIPAGWSDWTVWQYSDGNGTLDHNVFNGNLAALQAYARVDGGGSFPPVVRRSGTDVNGDGISDICALSSAGVVCELAKGDGTFTEITGPGWSEAKGWKPAGYASTVQLADVNGDGKADVCGRANVGFGCQLSDGAGFPAATATPPVPWSDAEGWNEAPYYATIQLADVNGDGKADACARGWGGVQCYLSDGAGFPTKITGPAWSDPEGWARPERYTTIQFADVNGDGKDDVCARGELGVGCYLSDGAGFPTKVDGPAWTDAAGWSKPSMGSTLRFVDIDGDRKADLCARAQDGLRCVLSTGTGFGEEILGPSWSDDTGWGRPEFYGTVVFADLNGDGRSDVCARGVAGMECSLFDGKVFGARFGGPMWSNAAGWGSAEHYRSIGAADVNHDGKDDLCGRDATGIVCAISNGKGFDAPVAGPAWSDASGWGAAPYATSVRYLGNPSAAPGAPRPGAVDGDTGGTKQTSGAPDALTDEGGSSSGGCAVSRLSSSSSSRRGGREGVASLLAAGVASVLARLRARRRRSRA